MKTRIKHPYTLYPIPYTHIFAFCLLSFFLFGGGCSDNPSEPEGVTYSGKVTLEGETDFSDVTIGLYKPVEIDPDLLEINQNYPNIGVEFTQQTEFYHREQQPAYSTKTNASGDWSIEGVGDGKYHIVFEKEGFGWQVIYNVSSTNNAINLKKSLKLSGNYLENMIIPGGTFVEIEQDVFFRNTAALSIESGVIIAFKNNSSLSIEGNFICHGTLDKNIRVYGSSASSTNKVVVKNSEICDLKYVNIDLVKYGILMSAVDSIDINSLLVN